MNTIASPKKQPHLVRERLLEAAAGLVVEHGLANLTLDAVAREAGVSKGGLLHHYPNKKALISGLNDIVLERFGALIMAFADKDPDPHGRFTRAYLMVSAETERTTDETLSAIMTLAMSKDAELRRQWQDRINDLARRYGEEEASPRMWIVRHAADGLWLAAISGSPEHSPELHCAIVSRLLEMTRVEKH